MKLNGISILKLKFFALGISIGFWSIDSIAQPFKANLAGKPTFQYSSNIRSVNSPLKSFVSPQKKEFLLSFDFTLELGKSIDSFSEDTFQNAETLKALSGSKKAELINNNQWLLEKAISKMGLTLDLSFTARQIYFDLSYPAQERAAIHWFEDKYGPQATPKFAKNEKILIQELTDFSMMISEGLIMIRISEIPDSTTSRMSVSNIAVVRESAHNKLQTITLFRARSTFEKSLMQELEDTINALRRQSL